MSNLTATTKTGTIVQKFGILESENFGFEKVSGLDLSTFTEVEINHVDGIQVHKVPGTFAGTREITKARVMTRKTDNTPFAVSEKKIVGIALIDGKEYKISSSNTDLKIGEKYNFCLRTSPRKRDPKNQQLTEEFELTSKSGNVIRWLVMDTNLLPTTA